jgi:hypothetical protein
MQMRGLLVVAAACAGVLAGCSQGTGQRCQVDSDCKSGMVCVGLSQTIPPEGQCQTENVVVVDAAVPQQDAAQVDAAATDVGAEAAAATDAEASSDASSSDDAEATDATSDA